MLLELEQRIARERQFLTFPSREWMPKSSSKDGHVYDVIIVGGGQSGLAAAYGLIRENVTNIVVLDRSEPGREGPWKTFARMITLRTPKMVSGLDFGNPSLTPQAWYEAQWGAGAWKRLVRMPREQWQDYLDWYRRVLNLPVRNRVNVSGLVGDGSRVQVETAGGTHLLARKVILCTGLDGSGEWTIPNCISVALPKSRYAHTAEEINFAALAGKRVGVLGNGASAFDNAATALENGAQAVTLCLRKPNFPRINAHKWMETSGFLAHYWTLPNEARWRFMRYITGMSQPPPQDTLWRCVNFPQFSMEVGAGWNGARLDGEDVVVETAKGSMRFDFLICGTGISSNPATRPELAALAPQIATWNDVFTPPKGEEDPYLGSAPYLGPGFQFTEKTTGAAPVLTRIHNFTYGATLSMGLSAASISGMKYGLPRLIQGVVGDLFREDLAYHIESLHAFSEPDITTLDLPEDRSLIPVASVRHAAG
ncbi:NAD(P)/FAD-dependent oxidoreductase [Microbacteriaceae bacterium K1510]|nr:NAD(P)/FAD-dependent oxidoreductase [Microbacteriaceae bacterium K1510]